MMFARRRDLLTTYYSKNTSTRYLNLLKASASKVVKPVLRGLWGWGRGGEKVTIVVTERNSYKLD